MLRLLVRLVLGLVLLSLLWVLAYRWFGPPVTFIMLRDRLAGVEVSHRPVPLEAISINLARAVIAAEDANFCTHRGFDVDAIEKAMAANEAGGRLRGASTISQQTAKNAFLWPGRTWLRKGLEAWFTVLIEGLWGKARIMEVYLNIAEWGRGIYGAEAASRHYFGKPARDLTRAEAARLAAILPQPIQRDAASPGRFTRRYAATIQARMRVVANEGLDACVR
ncbi:MAG: monofunctional biosynthetic peptidoglycan transglycosylase [Sphingomonadaceae bacterium]